MSDLLDLAEQQLRMAFESLQEPDAGFQRHASINTSLLHLERALKYTLVFLLDGAAKSRGRVSRSSVEELCRQLQGLPGVARQLFEEFSASDSWLQHSNWALQSLDFSAAEWKKRFPEADTVENLIASNAALLKPSHWTQLKLATLKSWFEALSVYLQTLKQLEAEY